MSLAAPVMTAAKAAELPTIPAPTTPIFMVRLLILARFVRPLPILLWKLHGSAAARCDGRPAALGCAGPPAGPDYNPAKRGAEGFMTDLNEKAPPRATPFWVRELPYLSIIVLGLVG